MKEQKREVCLYFKVLGLGQDENGNPCYTGLKIGLGPRKKYIPYPELQKKILAVPNWKDKVLHFLHFDEMGIMPKDIDIMTPEEYDRDYGSEEAKA